MRSMRILWSILLALAGLVVVVGLIVLGAVLVSQHQTSQHQDDLAAFYTPPEQLPTELGAVIRSEPLGVAVPGANAYRMLYVSETPSGTPAASGAMIFIPTAAAPPGGRPVVAWAHGTVGQGDACAPSRSGDVLSDTTNWLDQMISLGWVVVATDYVGLGTPGLNNYLVGQAEARDVVNSVRAARSFPDADAGDSWVVWGHSQGGHSALWTGELAGTLAPELHLLGVAAAAPAANLLPIVSAQWPGTVGWVIGPEVAVSWPPNYPELSLDTVVSKAGLENYEGMAAECTKVAGMQGMARTTFGQGFFDVNPVTQPQWRAVATAQTPPVLPGSMPVFVAQGTADEVVLPGPNALLQEQWCAAGARLTMLWMGGIDHMKAAVTAGPAVVPWLADRFAGRPAGRTCATPPPVPASTS
jgi:pimeloyl-ACP methyl ester carboxylesterase